MKWRNVICLHRASIRQSSISQQEYQHDYVKLGGWFCDEQQAGGIWTDWSGSCHLQWDSNPEVYQKIISTRLIIAMSQYCGLMSHNHIIVLLQFMSSRLWFAQTSGKLKALFSFMTRPQVGRVRTFLFFERMNFD